MTDTDQPLVSLRGVVFAYDRSRIIDGVDLDVWPRDYLAIIGPNGGGKTTLLKLILGLLKPDAGSVTWHDRHARRHVGYVPQFAAFEREFPLTVRDVVLMGRLRGQRLLQRPGREDADRADATLEQLGLDGIADQPVGALSGGQLQRVLIARALVSDPAILFLDEPIASIDTDSRFALTAMLKELNSRMPIVVVTHDITAFAADVRHIACINRRLYYHGDGELDSACLEETYGCPVELVAHGTPHRVLRQHHGH